MKPRLVVLLALVLAAGAASVRIASADPRCAEASEQRMGHGNLSVAAVVIHSARAYVRPGGKLRQRFDKIGIDGGPQVFAVVGRVVDSNCRTRWYHVQLPVRPNGVTGYVHSYAVHLFAVRTKLVVDLKQRRLTFYRRGRVVLRTPAAIGTPATPTPRGRFYIKEKLLAANPHGAFGPGALGVSSYSPVLTGWAEGGPIGIHGTDDPSSIGRPRSNGCVRVPNQVALRLLRIVPLGTPVVVR